MAFIQQPISGYSLKQRRRRDPLSNWFPFLLFTGILFGVVGVFIGFAWLFNAWPFAETEANPCKSTFNPSGLEFCKVGNEQASIGIGSPDIVIPTGILPAGDVPCNYHEHISRPSPKIFIV